MDQSKRKMNKKSLHSFYGIEHLEFLIILLDKKITIFNNILNRWKKLTEKILSIDTN